MHRLAGRDHRQCARGRDAQRVHRLADEHLAQHRADGRLAVPAARKRRPPRPLKAMSRRRPCGRSPRRAAARARRPAAARTRRTGGPHRPAPAVRRPRARGCRRRCAAPRSPSTAAIEAQLFGQRLVEEQQPRRRHFGRLPWHVEALEVAGIGVVEPKQGIGRRLHPTSLTKFPARVPSKVDIASAPPQVRPLRIACRRHRGVERSAAGCVSERAFISAAPRCR